MVRMYLQSTGYDGLCHLLSYTPPRPLSTVCVRGWVGDCVGVCVCVCVDGWVAWLSRRGSQGAALKAWLSRRGSQGAALKAWLSRRGSQGVATGYLRGASPLSRRRGQGVVGVGVGLRRRGPPPASSPTPTSSPTPASPTLSEGVVHQGVGVALVPHPPQRVARHLPRPPPRCNFSTKLLGSVH